LAKNTQSGGEFFGVHVSNNGKIMIFAGGIPLKRDGKVVGAIGVSGGSGIRIMPSPQPALRVLTRRTETYTRRTNHVASLFWP